MKLQLFLGRYGNLSLRVNEIPIVVVIYVEVGAYRKLFGPALISIFGKKYPLRSLIS